jgi:photosystem II stability/assembly factor-like uncharacterized protein
VKNLLLIFGFTVLANFANAQWNVLDISTVTTQTFQTVYFLDSLNGWLGGNNGTIVHTSDGGANWSLQNSGSTYTISTIYFADSLHGWAGTDGSEVLKTDDAGSNWTIQSLNGNFCFTHFTDTLYGLIASRTGVIYETVDGGQNWFTLSDSAPIGHVFVLDAQHAWGVGSGFIRKFDGTHTVQTYFSGSNDFYSIYFIDSLRGWTVGYNDVILKTVDGGNIWTIDHTTSNGRYLMSVFFLDSLNGWAVGDFGEIYKYDGNTWTLQNSNLAQNITCIYFPDLRHGWATSWGGKLVYTDIFLNQFEVNDNNTSTLSIFPNPAGNTININLNKEETITISNMTGDILISKHFINDSEKNCGLDVSLLSPGVYFVKVANQVKRFIKD